MGTEYETDADKFWKRIVYTGGHDSTTLAVHSGKIDAGFVASHRFDNVVAKGKVKLEDFNILWRSLLFHKTHLCIVENCVTQ